MPLFASHAATYRSIIINGLNKMVYRVDDDVIYIVAFWDTRMEPEEQAARVKLPIPLTERNIRRRGSTQESRRRPFGLGLLGKMK